ncbi:MAG: hypothetical protein H6558_17295, partial [Lewinellaceae bacterium]|nr:hypothetical protein [Lewinellaceae bacterium]
MAAGYFFAFSLLSFFPALVKPRYPSAAKKPEARASDSTIAQALALATGLLLLSFGNLSGQESSIIYPPDISGYSSRYSVEKFTHEQGLSDNTVNACLQSRKGYLWFGTNDGLNRYDGYSFTVYKHRPGDSTSISNNKINAMLEDEAGILWIATDGGLNRFDPRTEAFRSFLHKPDDPKSLSNNVAKAILAEGPGSLWVGTAHGLNRFDKASQTFSRFWHTALHHRPWEEAPSHDINSLGWSSDNQLIIGYWGMGLMLFDKKNGSFRQIHTTEGDPGLYLTADWIGPPENGKNWVVAGGRLFQYETDGRLHRISPENVKVAGEALNAFLPVRTGFYLVAAQNGLYILGADLQITGYYVPEANEPASPNHNRVYSAIEDRAGDIWFGTGGAGVFHLSMVGKPFTNFHYQAGQENGLPHNYINALLEVGADEVWVGARRHGLKKFNPRTHRFQSMPASFQAPAGLNSNEISALFKDSRGNIWIGTWGGGLNLYRPTTDTFGHFLNNKEDTTSLLDNFVTDIMESTRHEIWVSSTLGVSVFSDQESITSGRFKNYRHSSNHAGALNHPRATCLLQSRDGQIWVGTLNGLHLLDRKTDAFILYQQDSKYPYSLANNTINCLFEDSRGQLWIGTAGGLEQFDAKTNSFTHYLESEGLANGYISGIQEDKQGLLWLATKTGISRFDPESGQFKNYGPRDGLSNENFNPNAFISSKDKATFFAGGQNGLTLFHPDSIRENSFVPPVVISSLRKYNTRGAKTEETVVKGVDYLKEAQLTYQDNIIIFELTALNFRNPENNQYAYRLEGFNDNWISLGTKREITFTNLNPGNYTLRVKASNNDGIWNEAGASLKISILPPWWATWWAYLLYAVVLGGILYVVRRSELNRQALKTNLALEKVQAEKLKELDRFKTRLYTNLTHEFRTPLTVILGMNDQIKNDPEKYLEQGTRLIEDHGKNLLLLINQLLGLSKLENKSFKLKLEHGDIVPYLRYVAESFQTFANSKNLSLRFFTTLERLEMDFDPEQIKQVMANLISNAVKFTPSGGEVAVRVKEAKKQLIIEVSDTGIGIDEKELPHIFGRFYQVDGSTTRPGQGTGIGLAHTQELVKLMGGDISVKSELGKGASFTVSLPIRKVALSASKEALYQLRPEAPYLPSNPAIRQSSSRPLTNEYTPAF